MIPVVEKIAYDLTTGSTYYPSKHFQRWLAVLPHNKEVLGLNPTNVAGAFEWVLSDYSGFLPQSESMHVSLIGRCEYECVNVLALQGTDELCKVYPASPAITAGTGFNTNIFLLSLWSQQFNLSCNTILKISFSMGTWQPHVVRTSLIWSHDNLWLKMKLLQISACSYKGMNLVVLILPATPHVKADHFTTSKSSH